MSNINRYGSKSLRYLDTCHPVLQEIANKALAVSPYDISIICGLRNMEEQNALYHARPQKSKVQFPNSKHNLTRDPTIIEKDSMSDALDFAPYINGKIYWDDYAIFAVVAGVFMATAITIGATLRWGGDWDRDGQTSDQTFMDWGHIELYWR